MKEVTEESLIQAFTENKILKAEIELLNEKVELYEELLAEYKNIFNKKKT